MDPDAVLLVQPRHIIDQVAAWGGLLAEAAGIGVIVVGALSATVMFLRTAARQRSVQGTFRPFRRNLGRAILLGLEFLVAADIIGTVLIDPSFRNLGVLALLVALRTFLSFTLTVEIEGRWPWQKPPGRSTSPQQT